ncbi:hypothetical protein TB1_042334 [Malus domestica]
MESRRSCFTLTSIKGIGRRFANIVCKKADVYMNKRAGELFATELDNLMTIVANPRQFKIQGCLMMVVASLVPNFLMEHPDDDPGFLLLLPDLPMPFGIPIDHSKWWDLAAIPM